MSTENNKRQLNNVVRIVSAVAIVIIATALVLFLRRPYGGAYELEKMLPKLGQAPVYVELNDGQTCEFEYTSEKEMQVKGIELLMVHTDEGIDQSIPNPSIHLEVIDMLYSDLTPVWTEEIYLSQLTAGEWSHIGVSFEMHEKHFYNFRFTANGCNPYFMKVDSYEPGISLGFEILSDRVVTYGEVFYYSIPLVILAALICVLLLLFGKERVSAAVKKVLPVGAFEAVDAVRGGADKNVSGQEQQDRGAGASSMCARVFNIVFLVLVFVVLALKVYKTAYIDGIYITADSDGYLREAVNLVAGNGFSYEGLAGYKSHFANWPIIYPAMIAGMMLITGANAYLASKYVTIVLLAVILDVLYLAFRDKAWIYSLALLNLGFIGIAYHTWSELPFILFLILFGIALGKIVGGLGCRAASMSSDAAAENGNTSDTAVNKLSAGWYVMLGASALAAFLTRYFGMYLWFVAGLYWIILLTGYLRAKTIRSEAGEDAAGLKDKERSVFYIKRLIYMALSLGISGVLALGYLVMNKIRNGNPTGVARGTWWDDYMNLTNDLIRSLVTEVFNVFALDVPEVIDKMEPRLQVWIVFLVIALVIALIVSCLRKIGAGMNKGAEGAEGGSGMTLVEALVHPSMVFIVMAVVYYLMFIVIRYRSSMDTFYFRFFAPATVLLVMGIIGLILGCRNGSRLETPLTVLAIAVTVILLADLTNTAGNMYKMRYERPYYDIITGTWSEAYSEIPDHSVILWNPMDFRSSWYRPDVYSGDLSMDDTWDDLCSRYYGSEYICMLRIDAEIVVNDGGYDSSITDRLSEALDTIEPERSYVVLSK